MTKVDSVLKSREITLLTKVHIVKAIVLPVVMYGCELDHKEDSTKELMLLNCDAGEFTSESLDCKEIQPVNPKGNQP